MSLTQAFSMDCKELIDKFLSSDSIRYQDFVKIWREMKFELVFHGRNTIAHLCAFVEEAFDTTRLFLTHSSNSDDDYQKRIAGLYLIYSLYHTSPVRIVSKVRLPPSYVTLLIGLQKYARTFEHHDVLYILCSLIRDGVFKFVATDREYGIEKFFRKNDVDSASVFSGIELEEPLKAPDLNKIFSLQSGIMKDIDSTIKEYTASKCQLSGNTEEGLLKELDYFKVNLTEDFFKPMQSLCAEEDKVVPELRVIKHRGVSKKKRKLGKQKVDAKQLSKTKEDIFSEDEFNLTSAREHLNPAIDMPKLSK